MSSDTERLLPPETSEAFESLCLDLWKDIWRDHNAQKNGRRGQPQAGVDVFGQDQVNEGKWTGLQCKQKDNLLRTKVTLKELEAEVDAARAFKPPLSFFILATTGVASAKVQERARELTETHKRRGLFKVAVWTWREIWHEIYQRPDLLKRIGPVYWPSLWEAFACNGLGPALHQLPPPVDLVGREAVLEELEKSLDQATAAGATICGARACLQGMPGVGKTALAVALAHRLRHRYPDAQLFLNLRGADPQPLLPASTEEVMQRVITAFRPEAQLPTSLDDLMPIYRTTLAEADRRIVLVLDNAANAEQIRPLLPPPNCLLLVTSRKKFQLPGFKACDLECLEPGKSRELLLKLAPRLGGQAAHAAELCGHLPLALEVFAGLVNNKQLYPVAELVERLGARQDRLAPVEAAFQVSSELLPEELRRRWVVLAVFPASFDLAAVASLWAEQRDLVRDELQLLVTANLVAWNLNNDRFRLHDLARQFCETGLGSADRWTAELRHAKHYRREAERADHLYLKGGQDQIRGLDLFDQERLNFESAFERLQSKRDHESATLLAALVHAVGYPGTLRFHPRQRIRWLEGRLAACKLIGDRQGEGSAMGNLGLAYSALGENRKAVELYEQAVAISRETGDRCGEGAALGNLGNACAALGETPNAIKFYEQSLVIHRENRNRRGEGNRLGSLGNAYSALGENRKAIDLYTQALAIHREIGDRRDEGIDLNNLGNAHSALGESRRAIEFQEEALAISRQIGDRRSEANALANLGLANSALGKIRKAIELHETALTIRRQIGDLRGEGNDLGNLGSSHAALGETTKAIEFQERALAISRQIGDRRGEGDDLDNLGNTYYSMHQARRAIELYENALAIRRQIGDRRGEGDTLGNLGLAHSTLGETSKATELHEQALTIRRQIGDRRGEGHTLFDSAVVLHKLGAVSEAIARAKAALLIFQAIDDPKVANVRAMLKKWLTIGRVVRSHRDLRPSGDGSSLQGRPSSAAHPGLRSGKEKSRNRSKP